MTKLSLKGYEFEDVSVKDSFNRREVAFTNNIINALKKIGVNEDNIDVSYESMPLIKKPAFVSWYHDERHHYYSYSGKRFIDNLFVVNKIICLSVLDVLEGRKSYEDFSLDFLEETDIEDKRKEARDYFGIKENFTMADVNKSYKQLAKDLHPDMPGGDGEKFKKLNEAHKILKRELT
ncbi:MAG: DnaJ domain-containing protein [Nanoarchaeota archaeon]|nr:DnaJ domain-containing protein [Nanoarchaeota archaeon]